MDIHAGNSHGNVGINFIINGALSCIQAADCFHIFPSEAEIKDVHIFFNSFLVDALGDDSDMAPG